ncbi:uncharacterized protein KY384_004088 [Bacidia gigantensis]|uniref:uncharacterized protein n=1 Tax=Bacidia gigantensis TaxID=2732470 RepID=UPI001D054A1F|nr:uncharacterized protein KY384_004088 [Bacidia gigantensis]KAG8530731.1 hypothetical protein KY384_004088 [Bacidia gigantensis]
MVLHFAPDAVSSAQQANLSLEFGDMTPASVEVYGDIANDLGTTLIARFYMYLQTESQCLRSLGCMGVHSTRSDSQDCFDFIEKQLEGCTKSHKKCSTLLQTLLPKRVLNIGQNDSDPIRLQDLEGCLGSYATLSHCWGQFQPIKTLDANYAEMTRSIAWRDLSNVFQDAVRICRRLRLQYLWIDALCIIQDSKKDWERESSKICDYYENAYITISAASSPNGTIPFLTERDPKWLARSFDFRCEDGRNIDVFARRDSGSSVANHIEDSGPLASRAWVWQETLLSSRVLHYTTSELIWVCKSSIIAEDCIAPRGIYFLTLPQQLQRCANEDKPYNGWHNLISTYSIRQLTFESDRLPALSGVAAKIHYLSGSKYLAGMWLENLLLDLCWSVDYQISDASTLQPAPTEYIAPSWAWPTVRGAIWSPDSDQDRPFTPLAQIEEAECKVSGLNPYGQVDQGHLVLKGPVTSITVRCKNPEDCWTYTIGDNPSTVEPMTADCTLVEFEGSVKRAVETDGLSPFSLALPCILLGYDQNKDDSFWYVMVLGKFGTDKYCRLGIAMLEDDEWFSAATEEKVCIV